MTRLELPVTILLPIALKNGNTGRTKHWAEAHKRRAEYARILRSMGLTKRPPDVRQRITITRILGPRERKYDPDSLGRGNAKELVDALTACGWWHDDSARWIAAVDYRQCDERRDEGPAVELRIEPADD